MQKLFETIDSVPTDIFVAGVLLAIGVVWLLWAILRPTRVDLVPLTDGSGRVIGVVRKVGYIGEPRPLTLEGKTLKTRRLRER